MKKPLLAHLRDAVGNGNAAALFYRIVFWTPKMVVQHGGVKWIANSAAQWCEQTGLTRDQHRRAITLLRQRGIVETEQHIFSGKNVTHVRLTNLGLKVIADHQAGYGDNAPLVDSNSAQPGVTKIAQLHIQGESCLESHQGETTAFATAHAMCSSIEKKKTFSGEIKITGISPKIEVAHSVEVAGHGEYKSKAGTNPVTINAESAALESAAPEVSKNCLPGNGSDTKPAASPNTAATSYPPANAFSPVELATLWKAIIVETAGSHVPTPTKKDLAQFKQLIAACSPEPAAVILEECLRAWPSFADRAKKEHGAYSIPEKPTLSFLVRYAEAAVNFGKRKVRERALQSAQSMLSKGQEAVTSVVQPTEGAASAIQKSKKKASSPWEMALLLEIANESLDKFLEHNLRKQEYLKPEDAYDPDVWRARVEEAAKLLKDT